MPYKPKKINYPWVPKREPFKNLNKEKNRKVYNSRKWREFSKSYKEKNPLCVHCKQKGIIKASAVTDHIQRVNEGGNVFDETNLQALCKSCHNSKSGKEAHGFKQQKGA